MIIELYDDEVAEVLACHAAPLTLRTMLHALTHADSEGLCTSSYADLRPDLMHYAPDGTVTHPSRVRIDRLIHHGVTDGLYGPRSRPGAIGLMVGRRVDASEVAA